MENGSKETPEGKREIYIVLESILRDVENTEQTFREAGYCLDRINRNFKSELKKDVAPDEKTMCFEDRDLLGKLCFVSDRISSVSFFGREIVKRLDSLV